MRLLTWPLMILMWIVLSPVYIALFLWMLATGKRLPFDDHSNRAIKQPD